MPKREAFYSHLTEEHITDDEYEYAKKVWKEYGCKTLGNYHDLCVESDVALLADVFKNFRELCLDKYGIVPNHYYTSPGLSWEAFLKKTGVELELLTDYEKHPFIERGMKGGYR